MTRELRAPQKRHNRSGSYLQMAGAYVKDRRNLVALALVAFFFFIIVLPLYITYPWPFCIVPTSYKYIFVLTIIGLSALAIAWPRWRVPAAIMCLLAATPIVQNGAHDFAANAMATSGRPLKIAAYNWRRDNRQIEPFLEWAKRESPDIVVIAETPTLVTENYARLSPYFPYWSNTQFGPDVLILSKYPLIPEEFDTIPKYGIVKAKIFAPQGDITIYGAHAPTLTTPALFRLRQDYLESLSYIIDGDADNVIVAGDFNASPWDPDVRKLKTIETLHAAPDILPAPTRNVWRIFGLRIGSRIDHIFGGKSVRIESCHIGPAMGSDHSPVICNLKLAKRAVAKVDR